MDSYIVKYFLVLFMMATMLQLVENVEQLNGTAAIDLRQPRATGERVKLYFGNKAEPTLCPYEGFHADPDDCTLFYQCSKTKQGKFVVYRHRCGPGTIYDLDAQICNHPRQTSRNECSEVTGNEIQPKQSRENDIDEAFELPLPITTQSTLSNLPTNGKAILPRSTLNPWSSVKDDNEIDRVSVLYPWLKHQEHMIRKTTPSPITLKHSKNIIDCSSNEFVGDLENCRKFYRCVSNGRGGFLKYEYFCSEVTVWDDETQSCNYPWAVKNKRCGRDTRDTSVVSVLKNAVADMRNIISKEQGSRQEQTQINYGDRISQQQLQVAKGEVIQNQTQINYGEKINKDGSSVRQNQTQISYGSAVSQSQTQMNYGNKGVQTQSQIDHSNDSSQSQNQVYESSTSKASNNSPQQQNKNACTESGFKGDTEDCSKFYRCVDNGKGGYTKYEFACSDGTFWDSAIEACNHAWAVENCGDETTKKSSTISSTRTTQSETTTQIMTTKTEEDNGYGNNDSDMAPPKSTSSPISSPNSDQNTVTNTMTETNCKSSGFIGDNNDCKKFYRCVDNGKGSYTKYEFKCGDGTVWDSNIEACNHDWAVEKCGGTTEEYNKVEQTTTPRQTTTTPRQTTTTPRQTTTTEVESEDNGYANQPVLTTSVPSSSIKPSSEEHCKQEGFMASNNDCKKFYRCVDNGKGSFTKYEFDCGQGTVWNQDIQACDHPSDDQNCNNNQQSVFSTTSTSTESAVESDELYTTSTSTTKKEEADMNTTKKPQTSTNQCESEGFYGEPENCKKFYRCVDNGKGSYTKYEFDCGEGTVWDQNIQACNHPSNDSSCVQNTMSSDASKPTSESSENQPETTTNTLSTLSSTQGSQTTEKIETSTSSGKCNSEGFYGDPKDCKKFYRCVNNENGKFTKYDFSCGEGTAWDSSINACNFENEVENCQSNQNNSSPPQNVDNDEQPSQTTESSSTTSSSGLTTQSSSTTSTSGPTTQSSKPSNQNNPNSDTCKSEGYFGNSQDCTKFYRCVDNGKGSYTKYDFSCGEGTIWDQDITACNHPQDVTNPSCNQDNNDGSSSTGTSESSSSQSTSSSTTESSSQSTSSTTTESSSQGNTSSKPINNKVNCTKGGFYSDPDDCKKFYRCVDWDGNGKKFSVFHFDCGEGTIWDPELDTCNYEDSVYPPRDCSGKQSQSSNNTDSTTTEESTTQESTTTDQPTTTEQTTTQKSTTSTTTQKSTTQKSTTQKSTTQKSTTQKSTTQKSTTQKSTTQQSTTQSSTQPSSTSTTQKSTTTQQTTTQGNDETTTDQSSTMAQSTTTEQGSTEDSSSSTTDQSNESTTESNQESTTEQSTEKECPETDDDQNLFVCPTSFRRHPKYCNLFYQCTENDTNHDVKVAVFNCPNNTIYDESQTKCVEEDKSKKKCNGQIAQSRRFKRLDLESKEPIIVDQDKHNCPAAGHYPFEKSFECSPAFLKCQKSKSGKIRGFVYRCPENYYYWSVSRRCEPKNNLKDCRRTFNDWSERWEIPMEKTNVAS